MADQNRFDEYKKKLLDWWRKFLDICGKYWEIIKSRSAAVVKYLGRGSKVLLQKLAAWTLKARQWLKEKWTVICREGKKLLQKLAAWALKVRQKTQPMIQSVILRFKALIQRAGEWMGAVIARFRPPRAEQTESLPAVEEPAQLPEPEQNDAVAEAVAVPEDAVPTEADEPAVREQEEDPVVSKPRFSDPRLEKAWGIVNVCFKYVKLVLKWIWRLRSVFLAIPVVWLAIKFAMQNMERLPEKVGLNIQASGEFAQMITRQEAVYWPLGITGFCLLLMLCSKKPLLPWVISIFTLVLPWLIWVLNYYA